MKITTAVEYFSEAELACKGSGIIRMEPSFAEALPKLRKAWGHPLVLNSVCRSPAHNIKVGGNKNSLHLTDNPRWQCATMAADVAWRSWSEADKIDFARLALRLNWRVGLHDAFCHIDRLHDLPQGKGYPPVFIYGAYTGKLTPYLLLSA